MHNVYQANITYLLQAQLEASPILEAPTPAVELSLPIEARKPTQLEASPLLEVPPPVKELPPQSKLAIFKVCFLYPRSP